MNIFNNYKKNEKDKKILLVIAIAAISMTNVYKTNVAKANNNIFSVNNIEQLADGEACILYTQGVIIKGCDGSGGLCLFGVRGRTYFCTGRHF